MIGFSAIEIDHAAIAAFVYKIMHSRFVFISSLLCTIILSLIYFNNFVERNKIEFYPRQTYSAILVPHHRKLWNEINKFQSFVKFDLYIYIYM